MNALELLPKEIEYDGNIYTLKVYVTAWDKLAICYERYSRGEFYKILCHIIDKDNESEHTRDYINNISQELDLDAAICRIKAILDVDTSRLLIRNN